MENNTNSAKKWKTIAIAAILVAVIALGSLFVTMTKSGAGAQTPAATQANTEAQTEAQGAAETEAEATTEAQTEAQPAAEAEVKTVDANEMLNLWNEDAEARKQLTAYMEAITQEGSPDYIPVENRIAVFDFDGTLFCETDPNYFDYTLLVYRVTEDPEYKDRASEFEKMVAAKIIDQNTNGTKYEELPMEHGQAVASLMQRAGEIELRGREAVLAVAEVHAVEPAGEAALHPFEADADLPAFPGVGQGKVRHVVRDGVEDRRHLAGLQLLQRVPGVFEVAVGRFVPALELDVRGHTDRVPGAHVIRLRPEALRGRGGVFRIMKAPPPVKAEPQPRLPFSYFALVSKRDKIGVGGKPSLGKAGDVADGGRKAEFSHGLSSVSNPFSAHTAA